MVESYNGWPASRDPKAIGINPNWAPLGHRFPGGVKGGPVEVVFTYLVEQLHGRVEPIDRDAVKDEWGWHFKPSANSPTLLSCHSSGTAIDYNASRHPNGRRGTFTPTQVAEIRKIQAELGGVVHWLGDATRTPDEMHFEIRATPSEVAAVASRIGATPNQEDEEFMDKAQFDAFTAANERHHHEIIQVIREQTDNLALTLHRDLVAVQTQIKQA